MEKRGGCRAWWPCYCVNPKYTPARMNRESEAEILEFCAQQRDGFDAAAWVKICILPPQEMAAVALFLAGVDWYGFRQGLLEVAEHFQPGCAGQLSVLVRRTGFDCSRFSNHLRRRLAHAPAAS